MEKNSRYFLVGLFVSAAFFALIVFAVWLAGTHDGKNYNRYTIYFHDAVNGLQNGAVVQYRGINVGRVRDIRLSEKESELVKVDIEIDRTTPIAASSDASLATLGVTGLAFIDLTTPGSDKTPPPRVPGETYPILQGKGTQLSKLFQDIPDISKQVLEMTKKLNDLLNEGNLASLDETLKNIASISHDLDGLVSPDNVQNISTSIQNISTASGNVQDIVAKFDHTADQMDRTVQNLNDVIDHNRGKIDRFAGEGLPQITEMTRETKDMARSVRRLADKLEQNPSQLLYKPNNNGVEIAK